MLPRVPTPFVGRDRELRTILGALTVDHTDECAVVAPSPNPCVNGQCTNVPAGGGYTCLCNPGFSLINGNSATPTCAHPDSCNANSAIACATAQPGNRCVDNPPPQIGYFCDCGNPGYARTADGRSCVDRNDCTTNHCIDGGDQRASCIDRRAPKNGYDCECDPGFLSDGVTCVDVDECRGGDNPCGSHGTCSNTKGGYQCSCSSGFKPTSGTAPTCVGSANTRIVVTTTGGSDCQCALGGAHDPPLPLLFLLLLAVPLVRRRRG